jgi:hypothetical protein
MLFEVCFSFSKYFNYFVWISRFFFFCIIKPNISIYLLCANSSYRYMFILKLASNEIFFLFLFLSYLPSYQCVIQPCCQLDCDQPRALSYRPQWIPKPRPHRHGLHDGRTTCGGSCHDECQTSWRWRLWLPTCSIWVLWTPVVHVSIDFYLISFKTKQISPYLGLHWKIDLRSNWNHKIERKIIKSI